MEACPIGAHNAMAWSWKVVSSSWRKAVAKMSPIIRL